MTPVFQRILDPDRGDCQTACIATILDLPYEDVPTWMADAFDSGSPRKWFGSFNSWLRNRGLFELSIPFANFRDWRYLDDVIAVASMPSQKYPGGRHAVVVSWEDDGRGGKSMHVLHDPNPGNAPYPEDVVPFDVHFLVPINPSFLRALP